MVEVTDNSTRECVDCAQGMCRTMLNRGSTTLTSHEKRKPYCKTPSLISGFDDEGRGPKNRCSGKSFTPPRNATFTANVFSKQHLFCTIDTDFCVPQKWFNLETLKGLETVWGDENTVE